MNKLLHVIHILLIFGTLLFAHNSGIAEPFSSIQKSVYTGLVHEMEMKESVSAPEPVYTEKTVWITAYSSTVDQTDSTPFITASNTRVRDGIVAANWLPFGAKIQIPEAYGDKIFVVEDRMHPRHGDKVDIWMTSRSEALQWGRQKLTVRVLD